MSFGRDADQVRAWQGYVMELVRTEGAAKRTTARLASLGVNGAGLTVMLAVFASTGGLTGLEAVVAGGTSAVGHKLLEALLGDQAVRALAARARDDLMERVDDLLRDEGDRFAARHRGQGARSGGARAAPRRDRRRQTRLVTLDLDRRLTALAEAARVAEGRLEPEEVERARRVTEKAGARLGLGIESTVVALAGPTGAGKSLLFNALSGDRARRSRPSPPDDIRGAGGQSGETARIRCSTGSRSSGATGSTGTDSNGLVLLDLPDFDSVETAHRLEVDRIVELADLLVWVVEPQKYADAALHDGYLRRSRHPCRRDGRRPQPGRPPLVERGRPRREDATAVARRGRAAATRPCSSSRRARAQGSTTSESS